MSDDIAAKFTEAEIVPDVLSTAPTKKLTINYPGKPEIEAGSTMHVLDVRHAPKVTYPGTEGSYYTLIMIDPDNLSRTNPSQREWLNWIVINIPADAIAEGMMSRHLVGYMGPSPQPRTGLHRVVFLLFEHVKRKLNQPAIKARSKFSVKAFMEKHELGSKPVASL
ncbi:unnamed protein product [Soboliphyme baturini]|uniref:Phosphatidylethanolamine-binding protein n=1 Tax=Soboliphyme baturini TaxID=241478 RepID=A0A183IGP5_9BILA|nr:unnamed protein product [Soboliphyme baturini]